LLQPILEILNLKFISEYFENKLQISQIPLDKHIGKLDEVRVKDRVIYAE
jgi:hypothetical protein